MSKLSEAERQMVYYKCGRRYGRLPGMPRHKPEIPDKMVVRVGRAVKNFFNPFKKFGE